ncbi:MAG: Crp/Fnr family transcriptional regulator [Alphaproteobacteria bacterium]|nr:Crp/Fnr family transcriptional regulator [Alphaproteobacteria bacterium]
MGLSEEVELLRNIPLFSKIEPAKLKLLAFTSERLVFADGEELFHQGDSGDAAYIIIAGAADIVVDGDAGPVVVAQVGRNDIVGEIAIICDVPRTATVKANAELETLKISKDLFFRLIKEFPEMSIEIMRELAERLEKTTNQLRDALTAADR